MGALDERLEKLLNLTVRYSEKPLPCDLWLQPGRLAQLEFFTGLRKDVASGVLSDEEVEAWGTQMFGRPKWAQVKERNEPYLWTRFSNADGFQFIAAWAHSRQDWSPSTLTLRIRPLFDTAN